MIGCTAGETAPLAKGSSALLHPKSRPNAYQNLGQLFSRLGPAIVKSWTSLFNPEYALENLLRS